ncbi:DUF1707 SHOCT-like domain-containing protein [Actinomadura nitritigenes]|uniref:DUF1707 SHOCT-like domain-containing protein n=1 Tax=Actinomadura nitritigenes TaxID=134602 RepID=UPI003D948903
MNRRDTELWNAVGGVLVLAAVALLGWALYESAVTAVSVPLLLPLTTGAATLWLGWREVDWWAQRRREGIERHERLQRERREALHPRRDEQAVTLILHRGPYESDLDGRRIGDAERDVVVTVLHAHFEAGRLDQGEMEERVTRALAAKTLGELRRLVADMPNEGIDR